MIIGIENPPPERCKLVFNNQRITITTQESVKICGITFSSNKETAYQANIKDKILKMERQLNIWRQRNVSTEGKILLVKTFGLSQLIYSLQATNIKIEEEKKIEEIIYKFIWNLKPDSSSARGRIRRETLQCEKVDGGLKAPNIMILNKAIKYKVLLRSMNINHPVATITNYALERKGFDFNHDSSGIKKRSTYLDMAITAHRELNHGIETDLKSFYESNESQMHRNYYFYMANHNLTSSQYINNNQKFMVENLRRRGITTFGQLKIYKENNISLEAFQLWNSFPVYWRSLTGRSRRWNTYVDPNYQVNEICIDTNKWISLKLADLKQIKKRLISKILKPKTIIDLNTKYNTNAQEEENPFITCFKMTKNVPLRGVQYKILHNAYPTMKHLFHWRIKASPNCTSCNIPETTIHAIWECNTARQTIENLQRILNAIMINRSHCLITKEKFLYGVKSKPALSMIFTLIKRNLILQREDKIIITEEIINKIISQEYKVEKYIATKQDSMHKFNARWKDYSLTNIV
jgi:hypothetical protein